MFEIVDPLTVRYTWTAPNPDFLPQLAAAAAAQPGAAGPLPEAVPQEVPGRGQARGADEEEQGQEVDRAAHQHGAPVPAGKSRPADARPVAQHAPSRRPNSSCSSAIPSSTASTRTACSCPISTRFVLNVSSSAIIPAKTGAGESDLQATGIDFADYTFLKDAEKRYPVKVSLWKRTQGSRFALLPNLNYGDDGLARPFCRTCGSAARCRWRSTGARSTWPSSSDWPRKAPTPCCRKARSTSRNIAKAWIAFDPDQANALLDEVGLDKRDDDGIRLLPDGRSAQIIVETAGESTLETDVLELVTDHWRKVGTGAVHPHLAARRFPQPRDRRRDHDVDLVGHRQWRADRRHESRTSWRRPPTTSCNGRSGASTTSPAASRARRRTCRRSRTGAAARRMEGAPATTEERTRRLAQDAGDLHRPGLLDRHRQRDAAAGPALGAAAQHAGERPLRLRSDLPISASTCPTRSGSRGRLNVLRYILWRIAVDDADAADHLGAGLHHHRTAAGRLFRELHRRTARAGRRRRHGADRGAARRVRLRPAAGRALFPLGRRHAAGRFRLFVRIPAAGQRRGRRPAVADRAGLVLHHHLHLADRLSDRHVFGDAPV